MGSYIHILSGVARRVIATSTIIAILNIILTCAVHTHSQAEDRSKDPAHHGDSYRPGDTPDCSLCDFYAHYIPKGADPEPPFPLRMPTVQIDARFDLPECKTPCKGLENKHINKGPPSSDFRRI